MIPDRNSAPSTQVGQTGAVGEAQELLNHTAVFADSHNRRITGFGSVLNDSLVEFSDDVSTYMSQLFTQCSTEPTSMYSPPGVSSSEDSFQHQHIPGRNGTKNLCNVLNLRFRRRSRHYRQL